MGATIGDILKVARSWIGYGEVNGKFKEIVDIYNSHKPLARGYKLKYTDEWCDCFISACAIKAGAVDIIGTEVGCQRHIDIFKRKGIWIEDGNVKPQIGDIILFNWDDNIQPNEGFADHIGIVEQVNGNVITTIEGNMDRQVRRRTINVGWGYIRGYARPKYDKEVEAIKPANKRIAEEIAQEIICGTWGNDPERTKNLKLAGYSSDEIKNIQTKVNEILSGKKKTTNDIALEVIKGLWGNEPERKKSIIAAGYDYEEVRVKVNYYMNSII